MIYKNNLIKELTLAAIGIFFILLVILVSTQVVNLLGRVASGRLAFDALGAMLAVWVLGLTPLLLILTSFISILTVLTRYWRDSEMQVWLASGLSLKKWIRPILYFVLPFSLLITIISLWAMPWAEVRGNEFAQILKQKQDMSLIEQGVFRTRANSVYFVEEFNPDKGVAKQLFTQKKDPATGRTVVTLAKEGNLIQEGEKRILNLQNGYRYEGIVGQADFSKIQFDEASLIVAVEPKVIQSSKRRSAIPTSELLGRDDPYLKGELMWRLSMPISVLILSLLAIPLSYYNPRTGRTYNILLAVLVFFLYQNGLTYCRSLIMNGEVNMWLGFLPMHVLMLFLAYVLFQYRDRPVASLHQFLLSLLRVKRHETH